MASALFTIMSRVKKLRKSTKLEQNSRLHYKNWGLRLDLFYWILATTTKHDILE